MACRKRKQFTIEQKISIFRDLENGKSQREVCREQGLSPSTLSTMVKNKETIVAAFEKNVQKSKRLRKAAQPEVEEAVLKWFVLHRGLNVPISGKILQEKATQFAAELGADFKCSDGWLNRFKKRHNICAGKISGEAKDVCSNTTKEWIENVWPEIRKGFEPADIFNADEAGLFFRMAPDKTLKFKNEKCVGGKLSKERITVLVCANMTGHEKRKLLVIGKSANPRCFKNVKRLPVSYTANKRAWMTSEIFEKELRSWDIQLRAVKRKILLLVDNCAAHPHMFNLENIKLVFLPPNTTSVLQPMDQGVIRSLKSHFRKQLVLKIIENLNNAVQEKISLLDAIRMVNQAWLRVEASTIRNAFRHGGLQCESNEFEEEDDLPIAEWLKLHQIKNFDNNLIEEYNSVDDALITSEIPSDGDILDSVKEQNDNKNTESDNDEELENGNINEINVVPQISEVQGYLKLISAFFESQEETSESDFRNLAYIEQSVDNIKLKKLCRQSKITDYFENPKL